MPEQRDNTTRMKASDNTLTARLFSGGAWSLLGYATVAVTGLGSNAVLARLLSPDEFGAYFLALSITVMGALFAQLGTHQSVVRLIARELAHHRPEEVRRLLRGVALLVLAGLVIVVGLYAIGGGAWLGREVFHSPAVAGAALLIGLWLTLRVSQTVLAQALRGFHDIRHAAMLDGAMSGVLLLVFLLGALLIYGRVSFTAALDLAVFAFAGSVAFGIYLLSGYWRKLPAAAGVRLQPVLHVSLPLFVSSLSMLGVGEFHLWILGAVGTEQQVALYGAAYRLVQLVVMPLVVVNKMISPMVAELYARQDNPRLERVLRMTATAAAVPAMVLVVPLVAAAGPVLGVLYGDYYTQAANVLVIMAVAQGVNVLTGSPGILLAMSDRQAVLMRIGLVAGLCGLAVTLLLVESLGAAGAALGLATGMVSQNLAMNLYCRWRMGVRTHWAPGQVPDLVARLRGELARRSLRGGFWRAIERAIWPVENLVCRLARVRMVECLGDSHVSSLGTLNRKPCLRGWYFRVTAVGSEAASAAAGAGPDARQAMSEWLARQSTDRIILIMPTALDAASLASATARRDVPDPARLLEEAQSRYFSFLEQEAGRFRKLVLVGVPLPAPGDSRQGRETQDAGAAPGPTQRELTDLILEYNRRLRAWAQARGAFFVDMDGELLDPETRLLKAKYVPSSAVDNDFEREIYADLLCTLLASGEFERWAGAAQKSVASEQSRDDDRL